MSDLSRRGFLAVGAGAAALAGISRSLGQGRSPNDTIRVAVLGVNGRGREHISVLAKQAGVQIAVLCDPDQQVLEARAAELEKQHGQRAALENDLRKVLDRKDVDAVTVATPNHWHSLATIWACQAGKDVYVEKPGSHNVYEGRKMVEAAHKHGRIVQHGVQLRSSLAIQEAVEHLRRGTIGQVYMARGCVYRWRPSIGNQPDEAQPPTHLDWNLWQGPAQERAFSRRLVHYNWHWHWDYGNGDVGNQGIHETDLCQWGLDVQLPSKIVAMGGKFLWDDDKETPEVLTTCYYYPALNRMIQFEVRHWCTNSEDGVTVGNIFYGSEGVLLVKGYGSYEIYLGRNREPGPKRSEGGELDRHFANFFDAMRSNDKSKLNGPVETAHYSSALAHLGNIAYRLDRSLEFDPQTERFVGDEEADGLLAREYRAPFAVPEKV
jgi:predicted dehydrogenase